MPQEGETVGQAGTRPCPYCNGVVRADAVTCRHCKRDMYSHNAARMVLPEGEWNTDVPRWMIEEESRLRRRWLFWKKVRRHQWHIVGGILSCLLVAILVRLLTAPPEPHLRVMTVSEGDSARPRRVPAAVTASPVVAARPASPFAPPTVEPSSTPTPSPATQGESVASAFGGSGVIVPSGDADSGEDDLIMDAKELAGEFEDHRPFAEDKYIGRKIRVSGEVKAIDTSGNMPFVLLRTGSRPAVKCFLGPAGKQELYHIRPGNQVRLRGNCDGFFLEILLSDCIFVP